MCMCVCTTSENDNSNKNTIAHVEKKEECHKNVLNGDSEGNNRYSVWVCKCVFAMGMCLPRRRRENNIIWQRLRNFWCAFLSLDHMKASWKTIIIFIIIIVQKRHISYIDFTIVCMRKIFPQACAHACALEHR